MLLACWLAAASAVARGGARAQSTGGVRFDPELFGALRWRSIGPDRGGRSLAVAGSPSRPHEYYFGAMGGGLWKTEDGGTTWRPVTDGQIHSASVGAVAVAESDPDVVYIGMGESQLRGDILQGDGVYRTTDGGRTWTHLGLERTEAISRVRVDPTDPDVVYVAALGSPWGPSPDRGVYRSRDGGSTWARVLYRGERAGAVDLALDATDPRVLYAAFWEAHADPGGDVTSGGPGSGLFKTTDGGDSWTELTRAPGLPTGTVGSIGVSVSRADPSRVYAIVEAEGGGIFRSDDAGATWTLVNDDGPIRQRPSYFNRVVADPVDPDVVYALNLNLFRSSDGGRTYEVVRTPHVDYHDVWIAPDDARRLVIASDGGGSVSVNGGESWTEHDFPTAQLYHVATTADVPYDVCGAQQDANTICVPSSEAPSRSTNPVVGAGSLGGRVYPVGGGESGTIAPHPTDPDVFFATGPQGVITRLRRSLGLSQARDVQLAPRWDRSDAAERLPWTPALVFSPSDPNTLYAATQHLWRTTDGGDSWVRISPDLTRAGVGAGAFGPSSIFAVAPSPHDAMAIWVGTEDGLVQLTRDGGATWRDVTPPSLPQPARISMIEASPHRAATAYVAAKRYELDDRAPYVYRTDDWGTSWTEIDEGIEPGDFVHAVRADPAREGLLYAGTEHGVYLSYDDGGLWQSLQLDLPDTPVPDLVVEDRDLVIATHGRSFWILDDVTPLRALTPEVASARLHVFGPPDAIRSLRPATVDYFLAAPTSVAVDILDAGGDVVRSFPATGRGAPQGRRGLNRFTWDLRYEGATVFDGMVMWVGRPVGPFAPPGEYRVRVRAGGEVVTRPLRVVRDPRPADVTDDDVRAQFELAIQVRDAVSQANETVIRIRGLKAEIADRAGRAGDRRVAAAADTAAAHLSAVEGELYQVRLRSQLDATIYPIKLNNRLANLMLSIETGDGRPTEQHYESFRMLSDELAAQLEALRRVIGVDVGALNRLLAARGLDPVG